MSPKAWRSWANKILGGIFNLMSWDLGVSRSKFPNFFCYQKVSLGLQFQDCNHFLSQALLPKVKFCRVMTWFGTISSSLGNTVLYINDQEESPSEGAALQHWFALYISPCEVSDTQHRQKHNPEWGDLIGTDSSYVPLKSGQKTSVWGRQRQMENQKGWCKCLIFHNPQCLKNTRLRPQKWCYVFSMSFGKQDVRLQSFLASDFTRILYKWTKSNFSKTKTGSHWKF